MDKYDRAIRILDIFINLSHGGELNKREAAVRYGVSDKTIQRDIEDIRGFLENKLQITVKYHKSKDTYSFLAIPHIE